MSSCCSWARSCLDDISSVDFQHEIRILSQFASDPHGGRVLGLWFFFYRCSFVSGGARKGEGVHPCGFIRERAFLYNCINRSHQPVSLRRRCRRAFLGSVVFLHAWHPAAGISGQSTPAARAVSLCFSAHITRSVPLSHLFWNSLSASHQINMVEWMIARLIEKFGHGFWNPE